MVLRGSKTKPVSDPVAVKQAITSARACLEETQKLQTAAGKQANKLIHDTFEDIDTGAESEIKLPIGIIKSIKILLDRLEYLETEQKATEKKLQDYQKTLLVSLKQLGCGGFAGMIARTFVAPIDRVKLLIQTSMALGNNNSSIVPTLRNAITEGGIKSLWRGNFTNCLRVFPYAAIQFGSYERFKNIISDHCHNNNIQYGFAHRLLSGACAGATAATLTYPLDVIRVRQAVIKDIKGPIDSIKNIVNEGGYKMFFKGWSPTVLSLGPFIAVNFATFDYLKSVWVKEGEQAGSLKILALGATAGIFAQSCCYPLDTIRRSMQMPGNKYTSIFNCCRTILSEKGFIGFYKGIVPNAIKIVPNNGIRFVVYTNLTQYLGVTSKRANKKD